MATNPAVLTKETYYYGQGRLFLSEIFDDGTFGEWFFLWDVSAFTVSPKVTTIKHKESFSGFKAVTRNIVNERELNTSFTLFNYNGKNTGIGLGGEPVITEGGTVTSEPLGTVKNGQIVFLENMGVSNVVINDNGAQPIDKKYYTLSAGHGRLEFHDLPATGAPTPPFTADYTYTGTVATPVINKPQSTYRLRYDGVNLAENNAPCVCVFYKLSPELAAQIDLITSGDELASMEVPGAVLIDNTKPVDSKLGQFGYYRQLSA